MSDISKDQVLSYGAGELAISARTASILPPLAALIYPWTVWCFFNSVSVLRDAQGQDKIIPFSAAIVSLLLTALPSLISYLMLLRPLEREDRFAGTRWITYLAFAAPAFYTVERVVFAGFRSTVDDRFLWVPIWAVLLMPPGPVGKVRSSRSRFGQESCNSRMASLPPRYS
jgi:hypothetical protein